MNTAQPQVEEKLFSEAELKVFHRKYAVYQEAGNEVNEFLAFLREQHSVRAEDGWQLGERGFVRPLTAPTAVEQPVGAAPIAQHALERAVHGLRPASEQNGVALAIPQQ